MIRSYKPAEAGCPEIGELANQPYNGWPELGRSRVNAAGSLSKGYVPSVLTRTTWQRVPPTGCAACFQPELLENVETPGMRWRFLPTHRAPLRMGGTFRTGVARHPVPLGDALLDKRNASYRRHLLLLHFRALTVTCAYGWQQ